jgi:hypothetical protein
MFVVLNEPKGVALVGCLLLLLLLQVVVVLLLLLLELGLLGLLQQHQLVQHQLLALLLL